MAVHAQRQVVLEQRQSRHDHPQLLYRAARGCHCKHILLIVHDYVVTANLGVVCAGHVVVWRGAQSRFWWKGLLLCE
jgi:hypothetical protein